MAEKKHNRILSLFLALLMFVELIPFTAFEVYAKQDYSTVPVSLAEGEIQDLNTIKKYQADPSLFENWGKAGDSNVNGFTGIPSGWQQPIMEEFLEAGVTYGVESGGKYYLPGVNAITGRDALAAALFYYYPTTSNGYVAYSRASGTGATKRKNTYSNAASYFNSAFSVRSDFRAGINAVQSNNHILRYDVFLLISTAIEGKSNGRNSLSNYSTTKVGYYKDNKTKVRNYDNSVKWWDFNTGGKELNQIIATGPVYVQAVNLMVDLCDMKGRGDYIGASAQRCAGDEDCSYAEFYKLLYNIEDGAETEPPVISEVTADISLSNKTVSVNYKDFEEDGDVSVRVQADTSGSSSSLSATFDYTIEDETGKEYTNSGSGKSYRAPTTTWTYSNGDELTVGGRRYEHTDGLPYWTIDYSATIEIEDESGESDSATDNATITIELYNNEPSANAKVYSPFLPSTYQQWYMYVGKDIKIDDLCSDPEGCIDTITYAIKYNGAVIASSQDFRVETKNETYLNTFTATNKSHTLNFDKAGTYVLEVKVTDEMGDSNTYRRNIVVTPVPTAPVAGIKGNTYTYQNIGTTFTDNSSDVNDDIVKWNWSGLEYFEAVLDENGDETDEGEWVPAVAGTHYNGTLKNGIRTTQNQKPDVSGTLTFLKYGKFRFSITVTDATGLTDTATHEVEVLEDIPVPPDEPIPPDPGPQDNSYDVVFINTDGTTTKTTVKAGEYITAEKVPAIVDNAGLYEHGWTLDGKSVVEPTTVKVNGNLTFVVLTTPIDENSNVCTVTFINTDGTREVVKVAKGGKVPAANVPAIVDMPGLKEHGWTAGNGVVDPTTVTIDRDMVFWVDTSKDNGDEHTVIFVNTDGTTTTVKVKDGTKIPSNSIPAIINLPEYKENGWTNDGKNIVKPQNIVIDRDMVFWVDKTPNTPIVTHTVTFINTDGQRTQFEVVDGKTVPQEKIPNIKDMPGRTENGWLMPGVTKVVDPAKVVVTEDITFWVSTTPDEDRTEFDVFFTNTDGTVTKITVPKGEHIPLDKIPGIIDLPEYVENGWTLDGQTTIDPETVVVDKDLTFWVDVTPFTGYIVTFINTDGEMTTVEVPKGGKVPTDKVPVIKDLPGRTENGWKTSDKSTVVDPSTIVINKDRVFWVDTTPDEGRTTFDVTFTNTDGTVTKITVPKGEHIPVDKIPDIIDLPGKIENGWTLNGKDIVYHPEDIVVEKDLTFWVDVTRGTGYIVTFINTDGEMTKFEVAKGAKVPAERVPVIKDLPGRTEKGWTTTGKNDVVVNPSTIAVNKNMVFWVVTVPDEGRTTFDVTFTNTDGTVTKIEVPKGEKIPVDSIPGIINLPGLIENGWTLDGATIVSPEDIVVTKDLTFWVDVDYPDQNSSHEVIFVNTDGSTVSVWVPDGQSVSAKDVPGIIDYPGFVEKGWTTDGFDVEDPTTVPIYKDIVFWVLKEPEEEKNPDDFIPHYDDDGNLIVKQNRSAIISVKDALSPPSDPIQWDKTEWEFISVNGYKMSDITFSGGAPSGHTVTFQPSQVGVFKLKVTLHNNYSDHLAATRPNSSKLNARTKTFTIIVIEDEDPEASLFVNNANPDFHNYPVSIDVTVAASATSPDYDKIGKYTWKVLRDSDNDGDFSDEKTAIAEMDGNSLQSVTFPVTFQSGVVGQFLAQLTVQEEPGQATLGANADSLKRTDTATAQFEVNWTPCISYDFQLNGNQWAYVDDTIHIAAIVKDETVSTCHVTWTLKKKVGDNYTEVATGKNTLCDVWSFNTLGGDIRITDDGFYVMEATITDDHGYKETFVSNEIRVYDLPVAVITDAVNYRWLNVQWQYKQSRKFCLDGNASTVDDSTGPALHQIAHDRDEWSITPVSGGAIADAVYVLADDGTNRLNSDYSTYFGVGNNAFDEQIAIITPGVYQVSYRVTNTYGKRSPVTTQLITIVKDIEPEISLGNPSRKELLGSESNNRYVTIGLTNIEVKSPDEDIVGTSSNFTAQYRYDSNNDGNYEDEGWENCTTDFSSNWTKSSLKLSATAKVNQVGWYQFRFALKEDFGQETLPTIIPDSCYIRKEFYHEVEVDNQRPQGTFDVTNKVYGDIVFAFGEDNSSYTKEVERIHTYTFGEGGNKFGEAIGETSITLPAGTYRIKGYGAQGGDYYDGSGPVLNENGVEEYVTTHGGVGAYAEGTIILPSQTTLYITLGGRGNDANSGKLEGGYNAGGSLIFDDSAMDNGKYYAASGGGATVIATKPGNIDSLSEDDILMVIGAGGGAGRDTDGGEGQPQISGAFLPDNESRNSDSIYSGAGGGGFISGNAGITDETIHDVFEGYGDSPICGIEEHSHDDCELTDIPAHKGGIMSLGHKHTDECYTCGLVSHTHVQDDCYEKLYSHYSTYVGNGGKGGTSYINSKFGNKTFVNETDTSYKNGFVEILYSTKETVSYGSQEYNKAVIEQSMNYENSFGDVPGADIFQLAVQTVETSTISTQNASAQEILNTWINYPGASLGPGAYEAGWTADGQNRLYTTSNVGWTGYLYNGDGASEINDATYEFTVDLSVNGSHQDPQGWTFNTIKKPNGHYAFYALEIEQDRNRLNLVCITDWNPSANPSPHGGPVYHDVISGADGHYHADGNNAGQRGAQGYVIASAAANYSATTNNLRIRIEKTGSSIAVFCNGTLYISANDATLSSGTFGPYTCSQWNVYFKDIVVETGGKKTLAEALTDVSFDVNHNSFVIWTEDAIPEELDTTSPTYKQDLAELQELIMSANIHLIVIGSSKNKQVMTNLLDSLNVQGLFIERSSVENDLQKTREFVAAVLRQESTTNAKYILVNEETVYNKYYSDYNGHDHWYAGGGTTDTIASSRWWYSHTPEYFCNDLGLLSDNELWRADEITMFSQTGRYYVNYKVKDNSVPDAYLSDNSTSNPFNDYRYWSNNYGNDEYTITGDISNKYAEIYVHRRPIADYTFNATLSATSELQGITVADAAYDLDHYEPGNPISREDKGLQMYEWTYQLAGDNSSKKSALFRNPDDGEAWINAELAKIPYNSQTEVLISYRVRDVDGVERSETDSWKERITGTIYYAPASYQHTKTSETVVINGVTIPAGTYITTSYEEAISELRAAADAKKATYETRKTQYETAQADANSKNATATQLEQQATAAEQVRDQKQTEVNNQQAVVNSKLSALNILKGERDTLQGEVNTLTQNVSDAQDAYDAAVLAKNQAKQDMDNALAALTSKQTELTEKKSAMNTAKSKYETLAAELAALQAVDTTGMTEDELNAHNAAITSKQTEVTTAHTTFTDLETEVAGLETTVTTLNEDYLNKKTLYESSVTDVETKQTALTNAETALRNKQAALTSKNTEVANAQSAYDSALAQLNTLNSELAPLVTQASTARTNATNARNAANTAANTAATAKTNMDNAKAAWDAAEAAVAAVRPITTNANVWTDITKTITIPDGVWSLYNTVRISGSPLAPVAKFKTDKIYYDIHENINITDMSYSPNGNDIVRWDWEIAGGVAGIDQKISYSTNGAAGTTRVTSVADMESKITQYVTNLVNSQRLGMTNAENTYKITLNVTDNKSVPMASERSYSVSITIVPSNNPPEIKPNPDTNNDGRDDDGSVYRKDGVLIYEYDPYDAGENNPFYTYNGTAQKKGTEYLDWTLSITDPDNHDSYGTANDSPTFLLEYLFERFQTKTIGTVTIDESSGDTKSYGPKTISEADGKNNTKVAPFTTSKDEGMKWGTYRITTTLTDIPNNGSAGKSTSITTNPDVVPKHLYVVPRIDVTNNHYEWEGTIDTTEQIPVGDTVTITVDSDEETVGMIIRFPDGIGGEVRRNATLVGTTTNADGTVTKHWSCDMVIPDTIEEDDLVGGKGYTYYCEGWTDYGTDGGYSNRTRTKVIACPMNVLAIKLYDFALTSISDPAVGAEGIHDLVPMLAFDELSAPELTKLGYSFYYELYSMGLKNDNDTIRIRPHFYGYNSVTMGYTDELDVYYKNDNGDYVLATTDPNGTRASGDTLEITSSNEGGHSQGYINEIVLGKDDKTLLGSTQYWTGRYGLPSSAVFVEKGETLNSNSLYKDKVLVMFEIVARKNGVVKYDYVKRGQWADERQELIDMGNAMAIDKNTTYGGYETFYGSIIVLDAAHTAIDNYTSRPVWRSTNH